MRIKWTKPAVDDLQALRNYIARDSEYYAAAFIEKILNAVDRLGDFSEMGRVVPEANDENIREIIFQNFRIIYRTIPHAVQILAIIRGSRDLQNFQKKPWELL